MFIDTSEYPCGAAAQSTFTATLMSSSLGFNTPVELAKVTHGWLALSFQVNVCVPTWKSSMYRSAPYCSAGSMVSLLAESGWYMSSAGTEALVPSTVTPRSPVRERSRVCTYWTGGVVWRIG